VLAKELWSEPGEIFSLPSATEVEVFKELGIERGTIRSHDGTEYAFSLREFPGHSRGKAHAEGPREPAESGEYWKR
jgi:hypothetical protein